VSKLEMPALLGGIATSELVNALYIQESLKLEMPVLLGGIAT